ncbi:MAG: response regulator transcription factor [Oscillospiraceae bacterium]|nr:response regulator transcription factor [Oscillospiraceae bacterium]
MIYLVEDDDSIRELVVYTLGSAGMQAKGFDRPSLFWSALEQEIPELILLDIMLPEEDGLTILRKLRNRPETSRIPVMMLTARASEYEKVIGLDAGADDYLPKPFGMMELIARVRALLRRIQKPDPAQDADPSYTLGMLYVSPKRHIVQVNHKNITLTLKEFDMLCLLLKNKEIVLTREQFLNSVWGYHFDGENRTVDVHIRTLRQKLGEAGGYIRTIRGVGYKIQEAPDPEQESCPV